MTSSGRRSMVLRGVGVHAAPVRLQGVRSAAPPAGEAKPGPVLPHGAQPAAMAVPQRVAEVDEALASQRQQARQQGHEEGLREGLAAARQRIEAETAAQRERHEKALQDALTKVQREQAQAAEALAKRFDALRAALGQQVAEQLKDLEQQAIGLAFLSIRKILGSGAHRIEALRALIEQHVGALKDMGTLRVHLNPTDLAAFGPAADRPLPGDETVTIVPDARLPLGGCVVHSSRGQLDVGLPGQLARLGQVWLDLPNDEAAP